MKCVTAAAEDAPRRAPTMVDVSRLAGCSPAVVSAVINKSRGNIATSAEMRRKVREAAAALGYRPHFASRSLARGRTDTLGIYIPPSAGSSLGFSYEAAILRGVEACCAERKYDLCLINITGARDPGDCTSMLAERRIDGLLLIHVAHDSDAWVESLLAKCRNVVAVNYYGHAQGLAAINFDDVAAARIAVDHLQALGHRRIGYAGGVRWDFGPGDALRLRGYRAAMAAHALPVDPAWVFSRHAPSASPDVSTASDDATVLAERLLAMGAARPSAIVAYNDISAARLMRLLQAGGLRIPADLSIVGIDDAEISQWVTPALTTVRQPFDLMGYRAAGLVIDGVAGDGVIAPVRHALCPPTLVVRASTGCV